MSILPSDIPNSKKVFLHSLTREEQLGMLFDLCQNNSDRIGKNYLEHEELKKDTLYLKGEISGISRRKDKSLTTSQKIDKEIDKRSATWIWYRDHVLANTLAFLQTAIVMALLGLAFGIIKP